MVRSKYILILHGWQSSKEKWLDVKKNLERENVKVIIPDLPGFKEETKINKAWNLDDYLNWVENFVKEKEQEGVLRSPFFLLGHSFGGRIGTKFALANQDKLNGLILVSSAGIRNEKKFISVFSFLKKFSFLPGFFFLRKLFYKFIIRKTDYLNVEGPMKETFKNIVSEDLTNIFSKIKTKTLIIWGDKDRITPISDAFLINEKVKESKIIKLKGVGHTPYLENPKLLAEKILDFIK
jgi:pimeloyl-ACP methyl ester carboxylesterase